MPVTHRELASGVAFVTGPREPGQARDGAGLARAGGVPGHARLLHGRQGAAADRLAADRRWAAADEPVAVVEQGTLPGQKTVRVDAERDRTLGRGHSRAGDHAGRPGRRAARAARVARDAAAVRADRRRDAGAGAGVGAGRAAARAGRRGRRGAGDPHPAARRDGPGRARLRPVVRHLPDRRRPALHPPPRRARPGGSDRGRDRPGHGAALRAHGIEADIVPSAPWPRGSSRRSPACRFGARCSSRAPRRGATSSSTRCASAARRSTSSRSTRPSRSRSTTPLAPPPPAPTTCSSPPASSVRFFAAAGGPLDGPAAGLDRPGHERRAARARRRARPRGRSAHARRADRRAPRRRRNVCGMSLGEPREHHASIGSTNERARELAEEGAAHGTLVTAERADRGARPAGSQLGHAPGRRDRRLADPARVRRPAAAARRARGRRRRRAVRAGEVAQRRLVDGRKVAGILVEARGWAVLGIGVNVALDPATLPAEVASGGGDARPARRVDATLSELLRALETRLGESSSRCWRRCASATRCSASPSAGTAARASAPGSTTPAACSSTSRTAPPRRSAPAK